MIAVSCGIKISAVRHLVLSQSTRVTDGQTDGRTDRITTPKTALAYARAVKTRGKNQQGYFFITRSSDTTKFETIQIKYICLFTSNVEQRTRVTGYADRVEIL